jgi:Domain of unknown function DUF29
MEELLELRQHILEQRYEDALDLLSEMEEMSVADKVNKIRSYARLLLLHLIKQQAESRTTRSWDLSIWNATQEIRYINQRRKASGTYIDEAELAEIIVEAYPAALKSAAIEAFGGAYDEVQLAKMVDEAAIQRHALQLIKGK